MFSLLFGLVFLATTPDAFAQSSVFDISSDSLNIDNSQNKAVFRGNVVMVHDEMTIKADKIHVQYRQQKEQAEKSRRVEEVTAEGGVELSQNALQATGERGVYKPAAEKIWLYENVIVNQKGQTLYGAQMHYDLQQDRVELSNHKNREGGNAGGGNGRVRGKIGGFN